MKRLRSVVFAFSLSLVSAAPAAEPAPPPDSSAASTVEFARDVLPILSANCFACHGPDENERQADLRLDREADAKQPRGESTAIVAGEPEASELLARLTSDDPSQQMPPPDSGKSVDPEQIDVIRRWISQGAAWQQHWAFEPLPPPTGTVDELVRARLAEHGLSLQPAASPQRLARRLSLDLIGLPPTPEMADALAADPSPMAYERFVDDLLQSPQFGEHWARMWLDLARYADTKGYEKDLGRTMWPYRDWVVEAFNSDMPLDQFTTEQLAGDLLPDPTPSQRIATAFHRNTMSNDEGGTDDEEFRTAAVKDRVNTTVQVWMGLTMGCAQCHTHKYDPITHADYYRFYAIFNQTEDADRPNDAPRMEIITPAEKTQQQEFERDIAELKRELEQAEEQSAFIDDAGETLWTPVEVSEATSEAGAILSTTPQHAVAVTGDPAAEDTYDVTFTLSPGRYTAVRLEALPIQQADGKLANGRSPGDPNFVVSELTLQPAGESSKPWKLIHPRADFSQDGWPVTTAIDGDVKTGWAVSPHARQRHAAIFDLAPAVDLQQPTQVRVTIAQHYGGGLTLAQFRLSTSQSDPTKLRPQLDSPQCQRVREQISAAETELADFNASLVNLPVLRELPTPKQRETRIHNRGSFLDPGERVEPSVLSAFHPLPESVPPNRLGVARWLVSNDNPLTPRVWANRIWARLFGRGIVETEEDFGAVGSPPTHRELLDALAVTYRDNGWSLKKLLKTIVMTETYRQSSHVNPAETDVDPFNTYVARGARYRLSAEVVRDQALAVSGLLSLKAGGPPVMPPQPAGLWRSTYSGQQWLDAEGEDRFRRGLYTYLKRTTPYPSFITWDAGSGEVCLIRRIRTNTPLQALVTLNDPVFLEAAAALAKRMVSEADDDASRAERGLRLALIRPLREDESEPLLRLQRQTQQRFEAEPEQSEALVAACRAEVGEIAPAEFAAWIVVASAILNLDEFLTRN